MFKLRFSLAARFLAALVFLSCANASAAQWTSGASATRHSRGSATYFGARGELRRAPGRVLRDHNSSNVAARGLVARADGTALNFTVAGFESKRQAKLTAFVQAIYPLLVQVYGEPAPSQRGQTVPIVFDASAGDGAYNLLNGAPGTIGYNPFPAAAPTDKCDVACADAVALQRDQYNLSRQMLFAFHGLQGFQADAWEYGFVNAAALLANWKYFKSAPNFNPTLLGGYVLPGYDFFNRPGVGNRYFSPSPSSGFSESYLTDIRSTIAQAAWLKVWVENPNFFSTFNSTYYARYTDELRKDDAMLSALAASIVPTVESLAWETWRAQQQILNTSIVTGNKVVLFVIPVTDLDTGDTRSVFQMLAFRFRTLPAGDDVPLSGANAGQFTVLDESGRDITNLSAELNRGQNLSFGSDGQAYFDLPNEDVYIGFVGTANSANGNREQGRFTVTLSVGAQQATAIFPYGVAGTQAQPSGIYGATTNALSGRVSVNLGGATDKATLARGAFGSSLTYPSSGSVKALLQLQPSDGSAVQNFQRNFAWSYNGKPQGVGVILEDGGSTPDPTPTPTPAQSSVTATWAIRGDNHWRLVSLPIAPSETDAAKVFQTPANELKLGRYRSTITPTPATGTRFNFGIDATRNDAYPRLPQNVGPGRA